MNRRRYIRAAALTGTAAAAGCLGRLSPGGGGETTTTGPQRGSQFGEMGTVYKPPHVHGMSMSGMGMQGPYKVGVMQAAPHRFWTVTGTDLSEHAIGEDDDVHLMAVVWHPDTGTVLPDAGVSLEITRGDELVSEEVIYPMLSQRMGFHYGGNFGLDGADTYTANVSVGGVSIRRTGAFDGLFEESASFAIDFEFSQGTIDGLPYRTLSEEGDAGAVEPMSMKMPNALAPESLPGDQVGTATVADADLVATVVRDADRFPGSPYLAVSARTPYNRMLLPLMGLSATLERDGETVFDGTLERTLDPELDYHYGAAVDSIESGDSLTFSVDTPPQVGRHLGYEKAFLEMPDVEMTV